MHASILLLSILLLLVFPMQGIKAATRKNRSKAISIVSHKGSISALNEKGTQRQQSNKCTHHRVSRDEGTDNEHKVDVRSGPSYVQPTELGFAQTLKNHWRWQDTASISKSTAASYVVAQGVEAALALGRGDQAGAISHGTAAAVGCATTAAAKA